MADEPHAPRKKDVLHHRYILLISDIPGRLALPVREGSLEALGARHFVLRGHAVGGDVSIDADGVGVVYLERCVLP